MSENKTMQSSANNVVLLWVGTLIFPFLAPIVGYLMGKNDEYLLAQSKEALNWSITATAGYFVGAMLALLFVGSLIIFAIAVAHCVFCVMGAIRASKNARNFQVPFAVRLIK